jgi:hypothetical protein
VPNPYLLEATTAAGARPANPYLEAADAPQPELGVAPPAAPLGEPARPSRGHHIPRPYKEPGVYGPLDSGPQMRASTIDNTPRTWRDALGDFVASAQAGIDNGVAAISEAPVHALNLGIDLSNRFMELGTDYERPAPRMVDQPQIVRDYAAGKRASAEQALARVSVPGRVRDAALGDADGFLETLALAAEHPGVLSNPAGATAGALVPGLVAGPAVPAQLAAQAIGAGASNAHEVEAALIAQGVDPDVAARTSAEVFGASTALNYAIPRAVPGGQAAESLLARTLTGEAAKSTAASAATRFAVPVLGETVGEGLPEGLDQIVQNLATGQPVLQGVGQQTALGTILGAPGGVVAGGADALSEPAPRKPAELPAEIQTAADFLRQVQDQRAAPKPRMRVQPDGSLAPAPESAPPAATARPSTPPAPVRPAGQTPTPAPVPQAQPLVPEASPTVPLPAQPQDTPAPVVGAAPTADGVPGASTPAPAAQAEPESSEFGPVLRQYRGDAKGAIDALREAKTGDAVGALTHPDVGEIDLVWGEVPKGGKQGYGLAKIEQKHPEVLGDLQGFLDTLDVVERTPKRIQLESADGKAAVALQWNGREKTWLLTAFEKEKAGGSTRADTAALAAGDDKARPGASLDSSVPPPASPGNTASDAGQAPVNAPDQPIDATAPPIDAPPPAAAGGAEPAANAPRTATGTKNAVTDAERADEVRDPVLRDLGKSNASTLAEARDALASNPSRGAEVVERLRNEGTGEISLADEAVLLVEKVRLRNARDDAAARASDTAASPEARAVARREFDDAEARINEMDQATVASGREWGRLGQFRQRMLREDYSFEALERRERVREGRPLTVEESAKLKEFAARVQQLEQEAEVARKKLEEAQAQADSTGAYRALVDEMAKALKGERRGRPSIEKLKANADESRAALRKMLGRTNAGIDPVAFFHLGRIGAYHFANGAVKLADWLGRMRAELGAKLFGEVEPALPDVFAMAKTLGDKSATKTPEQVLAGVDPANVTHRDVVELARAHLLAGVTGEGPVMQAVHKDLQGIAPEMTERDVRRLFADYGKVKFPSRDADKVALRELRALVQLQESIDRLAEGRDALKTGPQRDKATQAIREKRKQLDTLLRVQEKSNAPDPEKLATYQQARAENLRHQIEDLEKQMATGERAAKDTKPAPTNEEIRQLTEQRDALRRQLDALANPPMSPEQRYQRGRATAIARQIEEIQQRLTVNDYARRGRPEPKALDQANTEAAFKLAKLKEEFARRQFESEMAKRHPVRKIFGAVGETMNLARAILTSIDLSAVLRQGGFIVLGHPVRGIQSIVPMLKAFASAKGEFAANEEIARRPNAPLYKKFGLELTQDGGHTLSKMEEAYMSRWIDRLPTAIGGGLVRGSSRSFTVFMNKLRADSFDAMAAALGKGKRLTPEEGKAIANYINVATGRGHLWKQAATGLNTVFFAPRLVASRFNLLSGQPLYGGTARTRQLVVEEYARFLAGVAVVFALAAAAADDDDQAIVSLDPRSTDFLKMRFGDTYIDPMAGLSQVTVFLAREVTGQKVTTGSDLVPGRTVSLRPVEGEKEVFGSENGWDVATRFARTKLAPVPGAIATLVSGENVIGEKQTPGQVAASMVVPMSLQNIADVMTDNGTPRGAAILTLSMLGMGVQYREPRKTRQQEVDTTVKKLGLLDKLAVYDRDPSATDSEGRDLRTIILSGNWQEQVAKLPKDERAAAMARLEEIRTSRDPATETTVWIVDKDGEAKKLPPPPNEPIDRQFIAWQQKREVNKAIKSVRSSFGAGDEEAARARLEELRGVLGEDVEVEVGTDENGEPQLTLRGANQAREQAVQTALRSERSAP